MYIKRETSCYMRAIANIETRCVRSQAFVVRASVKRRRKRSNAYVYARADYQRGMQERTRLCAPDYAHKLVAALLRDTKREEDRGEREAERGETRGLSETRGVIRHQKRINKCQVARRWREGG